MSPIHFSTPLVRGVENTLNKFDYSLVLYNTDEDHKKEEEFLRWMLEKRADGIILAPTGDSKMFMELKQMRHYWWKVKPRVKVS